jgi:HD-GYP domain-containing protein (c-di-GMP phosphodiesterase class II)
MSRVMRRTPSSVPAAQASADYERGGDSYIRRRGRDFIIALYSASRALKLYPLENAAVQNALHELTSMADDLLKHERELELRVSGEFIFINATRLRLDLDNYASFSRILMMFRDAGVGVCRVEEGAGPREWTSLLTILPSATTVEVSARFAHVTGRLEAAAIRSFALSGPTDTDDEDFREKAKEAAKRTYAQSVTVTKEVINSVRMGRSPNIKKIKRAVQSIVDQILNEETSLLGLTTLRDYDEYTFTHSVNVCIFSVALGRKIGLTKLQLYDLGVAALLHDIGKSRVPLEILNKPDGLNDEEWRMMSAHPWLGVLALFQMRGQAELPYRAMVVAHEHHMKTDLTGYPKHLRERQMSIYSKIVAVADGFDAATSRRVYQTEPLTPVAVLAEMRNNPRRGMDPVIVKAFVSLVGHYPVGTLVVLDTFELAVVHAVNPVPEAISRPIVRVISDERGNLLHPGTLVDLHQQDGTGRFLRTIIKLADPDRYGIRVSDYFA